jgi:RNA polymerase sigma-70 factor (ECF subfamily)
MCDYETALIRFTRSLVRDADAALDCVQDTFLRAYESLDRGREINRQWLYTVARNRAIDELRLRRRLQPEGEHPAVPPFDAPSETGLTVQQTLARLPRHYREVLYLFAVAGFKTDEIAVMLGTTGSAVRQRLYRACQEFRRVYAEAENAERQR